LVSSKTPVPESIIQRNDLLSISVSSLNPEASYIFNAPNIPSIPSTTNGVQSNGYLVGEDGYLQFPVLGNIQAAGLTKNQLKKEITRRLITNKLLVDPIVSVKFLNYRVTVLGEVNHPNTLSVPNEKISLLEAIGMAGDLTIYANRRNVLIIREEEDKKQIKRLDLNSNDIFTSPYYYLKSNDIVYVEPNKARIASAKNNNSRVWLPIVFSGVTMIAIVVDRLFR
jgi:polysaccharide export outer membrane protein